MNGLDNPNYDDWKLNPPDEEESHFKCDECSAIFYPDDIYYSLDGLCLCEDCASDWLEEQAQRATERECYD